MKTLAFISVLLFSFVGRSGYEPEVIKEISKKTKINPAKWLTEKRELIVAEVSFYVEGKSIQVQHVECKYPQLKEALQQSMDKIALKKNYREYRMHTIRFLFEHE